MLTQEQFEKYLIGALNRDVDSERAIYEGSVDYVYNIVLKYVSDRDDAADVAQETMIQAFEKLKNYNPSKGKFK
jgi:DNA-directed RNA polymerase specialized sigma24 family protein